MNKPTVKERLAALERQVADLQAARNGTQTKDWRSTIGFFTGDEVMKKIDQTAGAIRKAEVLAFSPGRDGRK